MPKFSGEFPPGPALDFEGGLERRPGERDQGVLPPALFPLMTDK
jgi:hypothetical protein